MGMLFPAAFFLLAAGAAAAFEGSGFGLHADYNLPTAVFGSARNSAGEADAGFGAGANVTCMLTPALGWTADASLLFNPLHDTAWSVSISSPGSHMNIPVFMGPTLLGSAGRLRSRGYLRLAGGINFSSITDSKINGYKAVTSWSSAFGYSLGAGVLFDGRFDLGLRIYSLGESDYLIRVKESATNAEAKVTPTLITLAVGYHFGTGR